MRHHEIPTITADSPTIAYEARMRFLNPAGVEESTAIPVNEPTLEQALDRLSVPDLGEAIAISFSAIPEVTLTYGGNKEMRRFTGRPVGGLYLATMWRNASYAFELLDELLDRDELPTYTAEWLARSVKANNVNYRSDPVYSTLQTMRPFADEGSVIPEPHSAKITRLTKRLLEEYPHLSPRFIARGMIAEDYAPRLAGEAMAIEPVTFHIAIDMTTLSPGFKNHGGLRKPIRRVNPQTGLNQHVTGWDVDGIERLECDETGIKVTVAAGNETATVREKLQVWLEQYTHRQEQNAIQLQMRPDWHRKHMEDKGQIRAGVKLPIAPRKLETTHNKQAADMTLADYRATPADGPQFSCVRPTNQRTESARRIVFGGLSERDLARLADMERPVGKVVDESGHVVELTAWSPTDIKKRGGVMEWFWGFSGIQSRDNDTELADDEAAYYVDADAEAHVRIAIERLLRAE